MAAEGLIGQREADDAVIDLLETGFCGVNFGNYQLLVTLDRFQLSTHHEPYFNVIRDLAVGLFRTLRHSPLTKLGINSDEHYQLKDAAQWHRFGHLLAPKVGIWDSVLSNPGMRSLTVEGCRPDTDKNGICKISVVPVGGENQHTVGIGLNDEYTGESSAEIVDRLLERWSHSEDLFRTIVNHLLELATR